jgi:hypothetical protein
MKRAAFFLCVLFPVVLFACSSSEPGADGGDGGVLTDAGDGGTPIPSNKEDCKSGVFAGFGPGDRIPHKFDPAVTPFPLGFYTTKDATSPTGVKLNYPGGTLPADVNEGFGFGTFATVMEKFYTVDAKYDSAVVEIDQDTLPKDLASTLSTDSAVFLAPREDFLKRPKTEFASFAIPLYVFTNQTTGVMFAQVRKTLKENTDYFYVITKKVKVTLRDNAGQALASNQCIAAPEQFRAVRSPVPNASTSPFFIVEPLRVSAAPILGRLESEYGLERTKVLTLGEFRTTINRTEVKNLREIAKKSENLDVKITGAVIPLDGSGKITPEFAAHIPCAEDEFDLNKYDFTMVETMVTGTFNSPQFCCVKDRFNRDPATGEYKVLNDEKLEFLLFIPKSKPELGIKPPFPLVVFHHAFQVCKETLMGLAGELARFGFASASFDMVGHGSRAHKPDCGDGRLFCDTDALTFIKPNDISATVSYLEQTLLDDLAFAEMLKGLNIDVLPVSGDKVSGKGDLNTSGDGKADLDTTVPFGFISQSLGSYLGVSVVAMEHFYDRAVFNVGLGGFYKFIMDGITPGADLNVLDESMAAYIIGIQNSCDRVESLNYSDDMANNPSADRGPVNVLFQAALNDEVIPHSGSDLIAYWMGLEQYDFQRKVPDMAQVSTPKTGSYLSDAVTLGYWQTTPAEHVHFLTSKYPGIRQSVQFQAASFIRTALDGKQSGKGGTIINPFSCDQSNAMVTKLKNAGLTVKGNDDWCK